MDMWPEPENAEERLEILPHTIYKIGPGRPKKVRIREFDEDGVRKRKRCVKYRCTTCNSFMHNATTCKSKTQDQDAMNKKRKQPRGKDNTSSEAKVKLKLSLMLVKVFLMKYLMMKETVPEINPDDIPKNGKAVKDNAVKDSAKTVKKKNAMVQSVKRIQSERQKAN
ncbi:unnamed protein product [Trifolium pratense]|uniref:Uncharacterized protein n=1 Tax=Trifolium pratense TaxID=57577 RepID=A0ACB0LPU1_TRIPR|nr:unnamed protein product [Trifolium pratense]